MRTASGTLVLTDALAMGPENEGHALGRDAPHILVRSLTCVAGEVEIEVSFAPRPEYGLVVPVLRWSRVAWPRAAAQSGWC